MYREANNFAKFLWNDRWHLVLHNVFAKNKILERCYWSKFWKRFNLKKSGQIFLGTIFHWITAILKFYCAEMYSVDRLYLLSVQIIVVICVESSKLIKHFLDLIRNEKKIDSLQFKSFHRPSHHKLSSTNLLSVHKFFWGGRCYFFFHFRGWEAEGGGGWLIQQLFYSRLLDMRWL